MRRLLLSILLGMALVLHFSTGVWSGDPPPKNDPAKGEAKADEKKAEEKKEEAKKPPEPDKNGTASKDSSWTTDSIKKLDEKSDTKSVVAAINEIVDNVSINRS